MNTIETPSEDSLMKKPTPVKKRDLNIVKAYRREISMGETVVPDRRKKSRQGRKKDAQEEVSTEMGYK